MLILYKIFTPVTVSLTEEIFLVPLLATLAEFYAARLSRRNARSNRARNSVETPHGSKSKAGGIGVTGR
jgi:hypothetical protein